MKKLIMLSILSLVGCGFSSRDNEMIGQVKKVSNETPLMCLDHSEADLSLGVMRNGTGSMSKEDVVLYVPNSELEKQLKSAQDAGAIVKITYDLKRLTFCVPDHWVKAVEVVK
jgi:hypothetical protein